MKIEPKTELALMREQLEGARNDLILYAAHEGESVVIDANIRHKREQIKELERRIAAAEQPEDERRYSGLLEEELS